jgi:peptidoglycan/LPS O-acetylase OafA/YrhL
MAFPLGVLAAGLVAERQKLGAVTRLLQRIYAGRLVRLLLLLGLACIAGYYAYHSGVGTSPLNQELISLLTAFAFIGLFLFKRVQLRLFSLFGLYSYEIYLFHWPLLYRYDFFYKNLPAWLATACYLVLFLGLGWLLQNAQKNLTLRPLAWRGKRWGRSKVLEKI